MDPTGETRNARVVVFKRDGTPAPETKAVMRLVQPADMEDAGLLTKAARLRAAAAGWIKAGMPLVSREARKERMAICRACEYFNPRGNLGLGACRAPGCGCTNIRAALATYDCPKHKWPKLQAGK